MTKFSSEARSNWIAQKKCLKQKDIKIEEIYQPLNIADLQTALAEIRSNEYLPVSIGGFHQWSRDEKNKIAVILTDRLKRTIQINKKSKTARLSAAMTWQEIEKEVEKEDLSIRHIIDTFSNSTIGGTLGRRGWLVPTWRSGVAHSEVSGISGVTHLGVVYRGVTAPRTASGPDLRAAFLNGEGRFGTITDVTINLCEKSATKWFARTTDPKIISSLQNLIAQYPGLLHLRWPEKEHLAISICGKNALVPLAVKAITKLGFHSTDWPSQNSPNRAILITTPWSALREMKLSDPEKDLRLVAATANHAVVAWILSENQTDEEARLWAQNLTTKPLTRATAIGIIMDEQRGLLTSNF